MVNKIIAQTTIKDCTIFKLGGSYAVSLNKEQVKNAGLGLGLSVNVTLKMYEESLEPIYDYTSDINMINNLLKNYDKQSIENISNVAEEFGFLNYKECEKKVTEEQYRNDMKILLINNVKNY